MSKMKGHIVIATTAVTRGTRSAGTASGRAAITKPQKALPTSPMKIRAGGQLHDRKPIDEPAKARATAATAGLPMSPAAMAITAPATAAVMPAMPSMPSMKLKALVMPTSQRIEIGQAARPSCTVPSVPRSSCRRGPRMATVAAAAAR